MIIITKSIKIHSKGENDIIDLTKTVESFLKESKLSNGTVTVFVSGSTGSIITIEFELGLINDFPDMLNRIIPKEMDYGHEQMWHDGNGHSHVKASLIGPSLTVPFVDKKLCLGTWQQVVFLELDTRSRNRSLVSQIMGE